MIWDLTRLIASLKKTYTKFRKKNDAKSLSGNCKQAAYLNAHHNTTLQPNNSVKFGHSTYKHHIMWTDGSNQLCHI